MSVTSALSAGHTQVSLAAADVADPADRAAYMTSFTWTDPSGIVQYHAFSIATDSTG